MDRCTDSDFRLHNPFFLGPGTLFLECFSSALEGNSHEVRVSVFLSGGRSFEVGSP